MVKDRDHRHRQLVPKDLAPAQVDVAGIKIVDFLQKHVIVNKKSRDVFPMIYLAVQYVAFVLATADNVAVFGNSVSAKL